MTQHQRIIEYMREFGSITPMEAFTDLGITKLATRIGEIRRSGVNIGQRVEKRANRYGETTRYMRYWIESAPGK